MAQIKAMIDKLLTDVSVMYLPEGYISEVALPQLNVKQKTGIIGEYGDNHLRLVATKVGGRGKATRYEPVIRKTDNTYKVDSHALEGIVTEDDFDNVEEPFEAESDEVIGLTSVIWLGKENALSSFMTNSAVITQNVTLVGTQQFSDYDNSKPIEIVKNARNAVLVGCGFVPNRATLSREVAETLSYHPQVLDAIGFKYNRAGTLTDEEIRRFLKVEMLHIGQAAYVPEKEGQAGSLTQLWGKDITLYYAPKKSAKKQVSLGYYIKLRSRQARQVFKYPLNNPVNSMAVIVRDDYAFHITNAKCAYLIKDAIA